jgi:hypothetical protein
MTAIYRDTPSEPLGPAVLPGQYTVKLTVGGQSYTQPLTVKMDPRVKTPPEGLAQQFELSMQCYEGMGQAHKAVEQIRKLREQVKGLQERAQGPLKEALAELDRKTAAIAGSGRGGGPRMGGMRGRMSSGEVSLTRLQGEMGALLGTLQGADATPTTQVVAASGRRRVGVLLGEPQSQSPNRHRN